MKCIGDESERVDGITYHIISRLREADGDEIVLPTTSSNKKNAESTTSRIIILFDFERPIFLPCDAAVW